MRPLALFLLVLLGATLPANSLSAVTEAEAIDAALERVAVVSEYSRSNPDAAGAFTPWLEGGLSAGEPVLVHSYPGLAPSYYIVALIDEQDAATSFITLDAGTGDWQAYAAVRERGGYPRVGREAAAAIAADRLGGSRALELRAVSMPNRNLYWHAESDGREVFVNLMDASDVRVGPDGELSTPLNIGAGPGAPAGKPVRSHNEGDRSEPARERYPTSYNITSVPHYYQGTSYHCGPASLEMVFDYWGAHVNQTDIGRAAGTQSAHGTWTDDMRAASHFSEITTAALDPTLQGYDERDLGYAASENRWSYPNTSDPDYVDRYNDLKNLISSDWPIILLTWYDASHNSGHFRVVKGYDDNTDVFLVHDPWYNPPYTGPDVNFSQSFLVDDVWTQWYRWGLFTAQWIPTYGTVPPAPARGKQFTLTMDIEYPGPHPFDGDYATGPTYAFIWPGVGYSLAPGEVVQHTIANMTSGGSTSDTWQMIASCSKETKAQPGEQYGQVTGTSSSYPGGYTNRIGNYSPAFVTPSQGANVLYVDVGGAGDYLTIQDGIDNSLCEDDWVAVLPGVYTGTDNKNLDFGGVNLVVTGIDGPGGTIIDCQNSGRGFYLHSGEDTTSVIEGFTIAAGNPSGTFTYGGGIYCDNAGVKVMSCVLTDNHATYGGGMAWIDGSVVLDDVHVINNTAADYGGGLFCTRDSLGGRFEDVFVYDNIAGYSGGGMYDVYSELLILDSVFHGNIADFGGAMYIGRSSPDIRRTHFQYNSALRGGCMFIPYESTCEISRSNMVNNTNTQAGWGVVQSNDSEPLITQSIIAFNNGGLGLACSGPKYPTTYHSLSYSNADGDSLCGTHYDNLFRDPYFCDMPYDDYTLADDSPCLPTNNTWGVQIGVYGAGGCGLNGIDDGDAPVSALALRSPTPNPFGRQSSIGYAVPARGGNLTVAVYDLSGRRVRVLHDGPAPEREGRLVWSGSDESGRQVASGVYFVKASFDGEEVARKMVVLR